MSILPNTLTKPIGVVGLGLMGQSLVKRLDEAKLQVLGFDVNPSQIDLIGSERSASLASIAKSCDNILLAVFNTSQVKDT